MKPGRYHLAILLPSAGLLWKARALIIWQEAFCTTEECLVPGVSAPLGRYTLCCPLVTTTAACKVIQALQHGTCRLLYICMTVTIIAATITAIFLSARPQPFILLIYYVSNIQGPSTQSSRLQVLVNFTIKPQIFLFTVQFFFAV